MNLSELLNSIETLQIVGDSHKEILAISQDTRDITKRGTLYCALKGHEFDGHDYIDDAIKKGATTIVCKNIPALPVENITYIRVSEPQKNVGLLASCFYGNPSQKMSIVGVTGTNGKTTVAHATYSSLLHLGAQPLLISTAGDFFNGEEVHTEKKASSSIEPVTLHRTLAYYLEQGCTHACLEVTSHALDQDRANGISFDIAVFTNLTQDHLDYHKTMEHYSASKKKFFDALTEDAVAITNTDSDYGMYMVKNTKAQVISYGQKDADITLSDITLSQEGQTFTINDKLVTSKQIGVFNAYNTTAVFIALVTLGYSDESIVQSLSHIQSAKGRMQIIPNTTGICAIVDYAHTPDALENVLVTLTDLPHKQIITVFGCGGDRDALKRPQMAQIAEKYSDIVIITNDNPRTEDPEKIIADIAKGFSTENNDHQRIISREEAIEKAVTLASKDDIILVAGKGHEEYQIIGTKKHSFSDQEVLKKYLV